MAYLSINLTIGYALAKLQLFLRFFPTFVLLYVRVISTEGLFIFKIKKKFFVDLPICRLIFPLSIN